jgi:hypothetical protein
MPRETAAGISLPHVCPPLMLVGCPGPLSPLVIVALVLVVEAGSVWLVEVARDRSVRELPSDDAGPDPNSGGAGCTAGQKRQNHWRGCPLRTKLALAAQPFGYGTECGSPGGALHSAAMPRPLGSAVSRP